jgi:hypothetical protein
MELTLKAQWIERLKLRAQGNTLLAQGNTLRAQGNTLLAQGDTLWANAIIEVFGDIKLKITYKDGVNYELENGEIYRADMPIEGE